MSSAGYARSRKNNTPKNGDKSMKFQNKVIVAFAILASANLACVASEEVQITSDNFAFNKATNESTFSGNVIITMEDGSTMKSEKVVFKTDAKADAKQTDGRQQVLQITSDNFALNKETKEMTFSGNVLITQNGATLKAEKATVTPASK